MVVEGGVDAGHVQGRGVHDAEGDRGGLGEVLAVLHAEGEGGLLHLGGADVDDHLGVDRVDRAVGGLLDRDGTVVPVVLVLRLEGDVAALDGAPAGAVVDRAEADPASVLGLRAVLQGGGEDDRLEGGGGLVVAAGRVGDPVLGGADAAVHGDDRARLRVDGGGAGLDDGVLLVALAVELGLQLPVDGLDEGLLLLLVDVEGDRPAAGLDVLLADAPAHQLLVGGLDEVAGLALHAGERLGLLRHGELHAGALGRLQPALLDHVVEDVVPALLDELAAGVVRGGPVVLVGGLEQGGEVGALGGGEPGGVDAVVRAGGGLDAVGAAPVVAGVHVPGEDLVLAHVLVDLEGDDHFLELAGRRLVLAQVVVLDVLLGDGRAALLALAGDGGPGGAGGALDVDAVVLVEGLVLGGDERLLDLLGDLVEADDLAVDLAGAGEDLAVGVLVDVALHRRLGVGRRHRDHEVDDVQGAHAEQAAHEEGAQELLPGEEAAYAALPRLARVRSAHVSRRSARRVSRPPALRRVPCVPDQLSKLTPTGRT